VAVALAVAVAGTLGTGTAGEAATASSGSAATAAHPATEVRTGHATVVAGSAAPLPAGDVAVGPLTSTTRVDAEIALRPRDPAGLAAYAAGVANVSSPYYHRYLRPAELGALFGPSEAEVRAVVARLRTAGLSVDPVPANRLLVTVSGSAATLSEALHTRFERVHLAGGGTGWSAAGAPRLSPSLASAVGAVVGLRNLASLGADVSAATGPSGPTASSSVTGAPPGPGPGVAAAVDPRLESIAGAPAGDTDLPRACLAARDTAVLQGGWTDDAVANAFGFAPLLDHGDLGQGQTIALWESDQFKMSDIAAFERCYFGRSRTSQIQVIKLGGYALTGANYEATLDIEQVAALAPDARILVYEDNPLSPSSFAEMEAIITQDRANIVSMSYGSCEEVDSLYQPGALQVENALFEEAAAEGITWIASAGDSGADTCADLTGDKAPAVPYLSAGDPASQPYVLGVGGVSMQSDTTPPQETAWNGGVGGGSTGGGVSAAWASPAWQAESGVPGTRPGRRQVPDVSAIGDPGRGVVEYSGAFAKPPPGGYGGIPLPKNWGDIGGTSVAAPQWAAVLAEIADSPACASLPRTAGGRDLGFAVPALYEVAAHPASYARSFTQVTQGNNDEFGTGKGYSAHPGYNEVTGLGTPLLTGPAGQPGLADDLCAIATGHSLSAGRAPAVSGVAPASGTADGGTTVTITGSGFPDGAASSLEVDFGANAAHVVSSSPTSIVVAAPAATAMAGAPTITDPDTVDVSVSERVHGEEVTSFLSPAAQYSYVAIGAGGTATPTVAAVDPQGGPTAGGGTVTVYGSGFTAGGAVTGVTFGGVAASFHVIDDDRLEATVPPLGPSTACSSGTGFTPASDCQVEVVVTTARGSSPTALIKPPFIGAYAANSSGYLVGTPTTELSRAVTEYDYAPAPVITRISPDPAQSAGQSPVTIIGRNLGSLTTTAVVFGTTRDENNADYSLLYQSPNKVVVLPPASPAGATPGPAPQPVPGGVSVIGIGGPSNSRAFSYAGIPKVTGLSVRGGPQLGGTPVTITGAGLADVDEVDVVYPKNPLAAYNPLSTVYDLQHHGDSSLSFRMPAYLGAGLVFVLPCSQSGCAAFDPAAEAFVYYEVGRPTLLGASATSGPASGGTHVLLSGFDIDSAVAVLFGRNPAAVIPLPPADGGGAVGNHFLVAVQAAPGTPGATVPITVVTPTGSSTAGSFHYLASAPSPPSAATVISHPGGPRLSWSAPLSDGGSPVTAISVVATPQHAGAPVGVTLPATARSYRFAGLHADTTYDFSLSARNSTHGWGPAATLDGVAVQYEDDGYRVLSADGSVAGLGSLPALGGADGEGSAPAVGIASTGDAHGYWVAQSDGTVTSFGDAPQLPFTHPASPVRAIVASATGSGYFLLEADGVVLGFGDAHVAGPAPRLAAGAQAVGLLPAPGQAGYLVLDSAGGLHAVGPLGPLAKLTAAARSVPLPAGTSAVGAALTAAGLAVLASDGEVVTLSAAPGRHVVAVLPHGAGAPAAIIATPDGHGYWVLSSTGVVVARGDAHAEGTPARGAGPEVAIGGP
jgi:hypothetical protein